MKTGVSTYSYYRLLANGSMTLFAVIGKAKEMGFDVIEFSGLKFTEGEKIESFAEKVKEECARVGIKKRIKHL